MVWYWYLIGVYIINRTLHGCLEIGKFSSRVEVFHSCHLLRSLVKYFSTLKEKFPISVQPCNILYVHNVCDTVEPSVSDHPKCKAKVLAYERWSLTRVQITGVLNYESYEPAVALMYKTPINTKYCIILKFLCKGHNFCFIRIVL